MIYAVIYIVCVLLANSTANILVETPFITFAFGTLFFGFIFTLRDILHITQGKSYVYKVIAITTIVSLIFSLIQVFDIRILIASVCAFLVSEFIDTEVFHRVSTNYTRRVILSNSISIPVDTILFTLLAFYGIQIH